ncbi:Na+/H+ antiporter [uncultured Microbacterium sp.]|uniref:Na+/H+ antiporter n=1 Tax=uncultured Microbacterium sp. TaxID=191216 RepID=UPI0025CE26BD|nr:Na+/H+ antiporter [uncultured Microbacterium sp.]
MIDPLGVIVLVGALVVAANWLAPLLRIPAPLLQLLLGVLSGFVPAVRGIHLPSEVVLVLFLPALLFWEAVTIPLREVRRDMRVILLLSTLLVVVTAFGIAETGVALGWSAVAALVLGAALAPTDATAVGGLARALPHRVATQLRAESLVNDGTALVLFTITTAVATSAATVTGWQVTGLVVLAYAGGGAVGFAAGLLGTFVVRRLDDAITKNTAMALIPFAAFLGAEQVHASGVIAVVVAGLVIGRTGPRAGTPLSRQQMNSFWTLATRGLNGALFVLIGIEAQSAVRAVPSEAVPGLLLFCVLAWVALLLIRFVFQMLTAWSLRLLDRRPSQRSRRLPHRARVVSTTAGFRGAVSLAVALAVPSGIPGRDEIVFVATGVVILTLVVQGMLLPAAIRWARFEPDTALTDELSEAQRDTTLAALRAVPSLAERLRAPESVRDRIAAEYRERLERIDRAADGSDPALWAADGDYAQLGLAVLEHKREVLIGMRDRKVISDATLRVLQTRIDRDALRLAPPRPIE